MFNSQEGKDKEEDPRDAGEIYDSETMKIILKPWSEENENELNKI